MVLMNIFSLQRFKDNGMLNRLRNMFLVTKDSHDKGYTAVTLRGIAPILAVLSGGVLFSCFVLMFEKAYHNLWSSKCKEAVRSDSWREAFDNERERRAGNFAKDALRLVESYRSRIIYDENPYARRIGNRV